MTLLLYDCYLVINSVTRLFFSYVSVGISVLMFFLFGKPYKRGFFCNDESLHHPYRGSTVTSTMLYVIGLFLPICTVSHLTFTIVITHVITQDTWGNTWQLTITTRTLSLLGFFHVYYSLVQHVIVHIWNMSIV